MAGNLSLAGNLFAAVDVGTNSFKLLMVRVDPTTGRFLALDRLKESVVLGRDMLSSTAISCASQQRAVDALHRFQQVLRSHRVAPSQTRLVATSAVREAANQSQFLRSIHQSLGLEVDVLSGEEEARLTYIGVLQFHPVFNKTVLTIDIGGGSTEFVIGRKGQVIFGTSLKLGHVTLTEEFVKRHEIERMREHIRSAIRKSGLIGKVGEIGFDVAIGSSGTIRAIEKAVFHRYGRGLMDNERFSDGFRPDWRFSRGELSDLVGELCCEEEGTEEKVRRDEFFKRRSEFIVAGAVLLEEIFGTLGIEEMVVSAYSLGEGVVTEKLAAVFEDYDLSANAKWRSVVRLATRFNNKKMMKSAALCTEIGKEIFEGVRRWSELGAGQNKLGVSLNDKDLEYLEAACLLQSIGLLTGKKGYHKESYRMIMNGDHLHGYNSEEVKMIALLAKHHRKKFPKLDHHSLEGLTKEMKQKFRILCVIIRVSIVVHQYLPNFQDFKFSHSREGFKLEASQLQINRINIVKIIPEEDLALSLDVEWVFLLIFPIWECCIFLSQNCSMEMCLKGVQSDLIGREFVNH
ncbi:uncharacterized protein LOC127802390 isoform X2 [Diospyros lotus]|uniref:uncharacterized protein LOC127802390 isoform X2 n=1 Tax=Diospyros lotus TaxID=55363 RepID=UPI002251409C|nr:uncharacterized protein LOC127802390 isoform X2 [Diospyros lotus]